MFIYLYEYAYDVCMYVFIYLYKHRIALKRFSFLQYFRIFKSHIVSPI